MKPAFQHSKVYTFSYASISQCHEAFHEKKTTQNRC